MDYRKLVRMADSVSFTKRLENYGLTRREFLHCIKAYYIEFVSMSFEGDDMTHTTPSPEKAKETSISTMKHAVAAMQSRHPGLREDLCAALADKELETQYFEQIKEKYGVSELDTKVEYSKSYEGQTESGEWIIHTIPFDEVSKIIAGRIKDSSIFTSNGDLEMSVYKQAKELARSYGFSSERVLFESNGEVQSDIWINGKAFLKKESFSKYVLKYSKYNTADKILELVQSKCDKFCDAVHSQFGVELSLTMQPSSQVDQYDSIEKWLAYTVFSPE